MNDLNSAKIVSDCKGKCQALQKFAMDGIQKDQKWADEYQIIRWYKTMWPHKNVAMLEWKMMHC